MTDRSPHDEADDRLTRACAADGHPPAGPGHPACPCGEFTAPVPDVRPRCLVHDTNPPPFLRGPYGPHCACHLKREDTP